jgi:hypothetical protein
MDTHTLSVSRLLLLLHLPLHSSQNHTSSSCIPRSHNNNNHFLKLFSTTHINRFSNFATIAIPTTDHTLTTPTLRDLCHPHVPDQFLQRQFQLFSLFQFLSIIILTPICYSLLFVSINFTYT